MLYLSTALGLDHLGLATPLIIVRAMSLWVKVRNPTNWQRQSLWVQLLELEVDLNLNLRLDLKYYRNA